MCTHHATLAACFVDSFQSRGVLACQRAPNTVSSLMSGCGRPKRIDGRTHGSSVQCSRSGNMDHTRYTGPPRGGELGLFPWGFKASWGPEACRGPMMLLTLLPFWAASSCCFFIFRSTLHCLHSMSECLGRIISNAFTVRVSVDKLFDAHVNMSNKCR